MVSKQRSEDRNDMMNNKKAKRLMDWSFWWAPRMWVIEGVNWKLGK